MTLETLNDKERYEVLIKIGSLSILDDFLMHSKKSVLRFINELEKSYPDLEVRNVPYYEQDILQDTYLIYVVNEGLSEEEKSELYDEYLKESKNVRNIFMKLHPNFGK